MSGTHSEETKFKFAKLREKILGGQTGKQYWRSLEEFGNAPEFAEVVDQEFPQLGDVWDDSVSRRSFIKVMGASLALAGLTGCVIQPPEKAIPYVKNPEDWAPGKPAFYATAMTLGGIATGLLARSNEGRPTKLEGNPDHPGSKGATDPMAQAALLGMYDPDRSQEITYRGDVRSWESFVPQMRGLIEENRKDGGAGVRFLTETVTSPTLIAQFKQILSELPNARWYQYEPVNRDNAVNGAKMAFGENVNTIYKFDQADRVLTLDADFMSGFNVRYIKDYSTKRRVVVLEGKEESAEMSRLYAVNTTPSLTGAKSDHKLGLKPSQMVEFTKAVAKALGVSGANSTYTDNAKWIAEMAKDLLSHKGKAVVAVGDNQPPIVHALAHAMNATLEAVGKTVVYTEPLEADNGGKTQIEGLKELIKDIDGGAVKMLVMLGGNPLYTTPADAKLSPERMEKIALRIHLSQHADETSDYCQWHLSQAHFLEEWSDTRAFDGTISIVQPLIEPLYGSKSIHEVVQLFAKEKYEMKVADIIKESWQKQGINPKAMTATAATTTSAAAKTETKPEVKPATTAPAAVVSVPKNFEDAWRKVVHDGLIAGTSVAIKTVVAKTDFVNQPTEAMKGEGSLEFVILPDPSVYDGRFANNGWLQEMPNPLTKITWENVALVSPATARRLSLNTGSESDVGEAGGAQGTSFVTTKGGNLFSDLVTVKVNGQTISQKVPMWIQPGQPDDVVTLYLGYGRTKAGKIGSNIGYNAYEGRTSDGMWFGKGEITKTGETSSVASTQTHFNMEGRDILRVYDNNELEAEIKHGEQENMQDLSMYEPYEYKGHKWGMSIDLNSCVGCNACVIACQSENNIPVVGKEQVSRSREMNWMRVDAYYGGDTPNDPDGPHFQPLICQQCEQAPCETVCPVHATVHSPEGLNDMVYNRCVGTRYCANNCPYKVRRFNFLLYQDWDTPQYKLMRNPEVTIRSRGVMEKCTYCVQRIAGARIEAQKDGARQVRDGEILTACQTACPADAIVFGDMNDPNSKVAKLKQDKRNYNLLNNLNTQPRTTYLASMKNQNKEMPDYKPANSQQSADHGQKAEH